MLHHLLSARHQQTHAHYEQQGLRASVCGGLSAGGEILTVRVPVRVGLRDAARLCEHEREQHQHQQLRRYRGHHRSALLQIISLLPVLWLVAVGHDVAASTLRGGNRDSGFRAGIVTRPLPYPRARCTG